MATILAEKLNQFPQLELTQEVKANGIFCIMPPELIPQLQKKYFFHVWNAETYEVRLMCSWDTTEVDIDGFVVLINKYLS